MLCDSIFKSLCPHWHKLPLWLIVLPWTLRALSLHSLYLSTPPFCLNGFPGLWFVSCLLFITFPYTILAPLLTYKLLHLHFYWYPPLPFQCYLLFSLTLPASLLQVCNTCTPVLWSTLDAPSQDQLLQIGNDNVALLMQGIHCFSARNDPPISLGHDLCGDSPVHQPCDGDGFSFSPTSPDDSRPNSSSRSTSTSRSTASSRGASFLENCSGGLDDCSHSGRSGGVPRPTLLSR